MHVMSNVRRCLPETIRNGPSDAARRELLTCHMYLVVLYLRRLNHNARPPTNANSTFAVNPIQRLTNLQ